ncbi:hypothetical protein IPF86_04325 [Candidatus Nomurabacteria bacterium]|jgi:hypothetical protein|nr:MAG: hypothetical protein IPF86_04325 [Candidatus Nomurabacteria bacterium]
MNRQQSFKDWCKKNDLNPFEAFSLAFVTASSARKVLRGVRDSLPIKHRLYRLTELESLKLSLEENEILEALLNNETLQEYWEEKVMDKFITAWKIDRTLPLVEERISISSDTYKKKEELLPFLVKKFFGKEFKVRVLFQTEKNGNLLKAKSFDGISKPNEAFSSKNLLNTLNELQLVSHKSDPEMIAYIGHNKKHLRSINSIIAVMLNEDPVKALKLVRELLKNFSHI